jgi:hypothetical protein
MLGFAGWMLTRWTTWSSYHQAVGVHIHGGPSFTLSFDAVAGVLALALGPFVILAGHLMLKRALGVASSNPVTDDINEDIED